MKKKIGIAIAIVLFITLVISATVCLGNPRIRLLLSVMHFSEKTLKDPSYILYDVDIMEVFRDYSNGDTQIDGRLNLSKVKNLNMSMYSNVSINRSFEQKKMAANSQIEVLFQEIGDMELYAQDSTFYIVVPMLDDLSYAFQTDVNLFMKMPSLTSDLNREWFKENRKNIIDLMNQIGLEESKNQIVDSDGTISEEFVVTIQRGDGHFIWELLGMEDPDYDVVVSMYLTPQNHLRRMIIDLKDELPGAVLTLDGENVGTGIFTYELPDNERVILTMTRSNEHANWIDLECIYKVNAGEDYVLTAAMTWEKKEEGFDVRLRNGLVKNGSDVWARGSFKGTVLPIHITEDVFKNVNVDLTSLERIDWRELRDNTDAFVDDILDKIKEHTGLRL